MERRPASRYTARMRIRSAVLALGLALVGGLRAVAQDGAVRSPQTSIQSWPAPSRALARALIVKYGTPHSFGEHALYWYDNGPWRRTVVHRDGTGGSFLRRGADILEQTAAYPVGADSAGELKEIAPGIYADAAAGEVTSRAESEAMNFLALNLAAEVLSRAMSEDDARRAYRRTRRLAGSGKSSPYLDGLAFETQRDGDSNHWNP